jgi:predicted neutral ceramidase superfamily lipid hydrolase
MVKGVLNPIGSDMEIYDTELFIQQIMASVKIAEKHLSNVEFGSASEVINIAVFGPKRAAELVGTANSIAAVLKWAAPAILLACGFTSYLLMRMI